MPRRLFSVPLFWRVFATNAAVMALAFLGLVFAPVTVSVPVGASEVLELAIGLVVLLIVDLLLLRPALAPLDQLAETMRRHDPLSPGPRAEVRGGPVVAGLAQTFNDMLDRLESERRESARRALLVQETCAGSRAGFALTRWTSWGCQARSPRWRARSSAKRGFPSSGVWL